MARRHKAVRREIVPDSLYESPLVGRLINAIMKWGQKSLASRIVYKAIELANEEKSVVDPLDVLTRAVENAKPRIEVKSRRVGGATYQVPMEVPQHRQVALALRWMVNSASKRRGTSMVKALAQVIKDAASGSGDVIKKRDDVHRMAQANRAFAHLRW